jgi:Secretion system C-terminal sorting domain
MVFVNSLSTFYSQLHSMKHLLTIYILLNICLIGRSQLVPAAIFIQPLFLPDTASLPLHNFTVTEKDKKAFLRWKADTLPAAESFYAVERSSNGIDFTLVGITKTTSSGWIEFLDESPPKGKIFYRVKLSTGQISFYSEIISANPSADASCKFYPNPVDKVLIVRSESTVEVLISDRSGKPLITDKFPGGLKVIDVSSLEPGIYVITLFQKETNHQVTEKLVKK